MKAEDAENLYLKSQNPAFRSILSILVMGLLVAASSMDDQHQFQFRWKQNLRGGIGRATYYKPMHLWDKSSGNPVLADFTTQFSFSIDSLHNNPGDGFAFFIAPNGSKIPPNSGGGHLGLQSDGIVNSPFVAVEFDNFGNSWDPLGCQLTWALIANGGLVNAFITYNSSTNNLSVLLLDADDFTRQNSSRLSATLDLSIYLPEWVTFGFSGTTGSYYELHTIYSWNFSSTLQVVMPTNTTINPPATSPPANPKRKSRTWLWVVLAIIGAISASLLVLGLVWFYCRRGDYSRKEDGTMSVNVNREMVTAPRKFSYKELRLATSNFADEGLLGEGGFGKVYLGFLRDISSNIAVKRVTPNSQQGFKELRHRNLVQLIGWCHDNNQFLIVYEFLPNKNLDYHLHREPCILIWDKSYKIAMGLASALFYLQEECNQCVLHRDIKSSNVLLDLSFNAKLGDFGLARLVDHGQGSQTTQVMLGTEGYIAPECRDTYKAIKESDIYSFGIVALEIATGKKAIAVIERNGQRFKTKLVGWVWELYGKENLFDAADPRLSGNYDMEQMERLLLVGLACAHPNYFDRPSKTQAVDILSSKAPLPVLLPEMPIPTYIVSPEDTIVTF
ncbi:hypothetical protein ES288_D04G191200v1 [Gossypium darwinii]|uniref:Protein kinase domain-containing protein n=1 Tax=Gossypium darwinii TaxID=34276 RepID=A0A5D2D0E6_GOSDA|nr:hypothetical protein ES288_D04G191200v1 [Gossypium darwinii]